jgi:hypothetical protein
LTIPLQRIVRLSALFVHRDHMSLSGVPVTVACPLRGALPSVVVTEMLDASRKVADLPYARLRLMEVFEDVQPVPITLLPCEADLWLCKARIHVAQGRREHYGRGQHVAICAGAYVGPRAGRVTLTEWVNTWYPALDLELTTLRSFRYGIEVLILPAFG